MEKQWKSNDPAAIAMWDERKTEILEKKMFTDVNVFQDMNMMHAYYSVHQAVDKLSPEQLQEFIKFRFNFLQEEVTEGQESIARNDADGIVDSLIDLIVVAAGTLDLFNVNLEIAWNRVLVANMNKLVGIKPSRPNPLGLPDLIKPEGWVGPEHSDNLGYLSKALG